jgi:hypothetical protein
MRRIISLSSSSGIVLDAEHTHIATFQHTENERICDVLKLPKTKKVFELLDKAIEEDLTEKEFKELKKHSI